MIVTKIRYKYVMYNEPFEKIASVLEWFHENINSPESDWIWSGGILLLKNVS